MSRFLTRNVPALMGVLAALAASAASAAPYGGDPLVGARTEVKPMVGVHISQPDVVLTAQGARIHGSVCRTGVMPLRAPSTLRIEHVDAAGHVVETMMALPAGDTWGRGPGCSYYDLQTGWTVQSTDTIRVLTPETA